MKPVLKKIKNPTFISFIVVFGFTASIFVCIICTDNEEPNTLVPEKVMHQENQLNNQEKIRYQLEYLYHIRQLTNSRYDLKETAAWTAFALYISGLVYLILSNFGSFLEKLSVKCKIVVFNLVLVTAVIIAFTFFAFIHAQYSAIYSISAKASSASSLIQKIINTGQPIENFLSEKKIFYSESLKNNQQDRANLHPLKIIFSFIKLNWTNSNKPSMTTQNTQEASLYLLMIIFNLLFSVKIFMGINRITKKA